MGACTRVGKRGCQQSRGPCRPPQPRTASPSLALPRAESQQVQPPTEAAAPCVWQESLKAQVRTVEGLGDGAVPKEKGPWSPIGKGGLLQAKAPELCPPRWGLCPALSGSSQSTRKAHQRRKEMKGAHWYPVGISDGPGEKQRESTHIKTRHMLDTQQPCVGSLGCFYGNTQPLR